MTEPTLKEILHTADGITDKPMVTPCCCHCDEVSELIELIHEGNVIHDLDQYGEGSMQTTTGQVLLELMQEFERLQEFEAATLEKAKQ